MNGSASPGPPTTEAGDSGTAKIVVKTVNGQRSPGRNSDTSDTKVKSSSPPSKSHTRDEHGSTIRVAGTVVNGDDEGGDSEAETLIDSPVKKKEGDKQAAATPMVGRPPKHRIGSLPVPTDNDDENESAAVSPVPSSASVSVEKTTSTEDVKDGANLHEGDADSDREDNSDSLSSLGSRGSDSPSRASSVSRAVSERPERSRDGVHSPNPRKRKHRASSVSLPNKRPSLDPPKRRLRGLHSEGYNEGHEESLSPKLRAHRRTASTQSAFIDGGEISNNRKRRAATQGPGRESKMSRGNWEESDGSSETTSYGHPEHRRLQRGVGRSTSTPGRPPGREHKRHVNKYGFTKLAEACEAGDVDLVREWRQKDPEQLEVAEFAGNKPLQIAALKGNVDVVDYLIAQGCQIDCANVDKDTPLIDAAENGHLDVVNSLLNAGVDPLRQNLKGQQALDVVTDDVDDADEIRAALRKAIEEWNSNGAKQKREEEEESRYRGGPSKELHFMARTYENLLKLVQNNDRNGVREFLDARVPVDNTVIAAAAKTGDSYLVNMLLVELPDKKRNSKPEKPLLSVLGTSHFEMVKSLTELDNFDALYRNRSGKSWPEIAEEKSGPNWRQEKELLQRLYEQRAAMKERRSSSPITKRDSGKRRLISRTAEDDSDEDQAPRRKNGRKLMSRRELRARGQANSDASDDDSRSEDVPEVEEAEGSKMKPPESPASKRTPTRSRTKSLSAQPPEISPRARRRSTSLRGQNDSPLPTLEETPEDKETARVKRAADEAREAEKLQIKREEEAEAEAKADAQRAEEEEAKIKAELERKAEAERKAEEARQAEIDQKRRDEEEKLLHRQQLVSTLPRPISNALDGSFVLESGLGKGYESLIHRFTPLQVLMQEADAFWVANVQAAPLLGEQGIELLLRKDAPGYRGSLADLWETRDLYCADVPVVHSIMACLPSESSNAAVPLDEDGLSCMSFDEELRLTALRLEQAAAAKKALTSGDATLRYVRLEDVLKNLRPGLKDQPLQVDFDLVVVAENGRYESEESSFLQALSSSLQRRPCSKTFLGGREIPADGPVPGLLGTTEVRVVHEK